jgi:glycerol dehydrogenase
VQLVLEGKPRPVVEDVLRFSAEVGLPTTLAQIGLDQPSPETLERVAMRSTAEGETIHNEPFEVLPGMVVDAIRAADALGREFARRNRVASGARAAGRA